MLAADGRKDGRGPDRVVGIELDIENLWQKGLGELDVGGSPA